MITARLSQFVFLIIFQTSLCNQTNPKRFETDLWAFLVSCFYGISLSICYNFQRNSHQFILIYCIVTFPSNFLEKPKIIFVTFRKILLLHRIANSSFNFVSLLLLSLFCERFGSFHAITSNHIILPLLISFVSQQTLDL